MQRIKNIVFDLGGVIITLNHNEAIRRFKEIGFDRANEILDPCHQQGIFLELEEGKLSREEFYEALRKEAGKDISGEAIDYGWFGFLQETPEYKLEMLEQLKEHYNLYLLSNTNPVIMSWARTPAFSGKEKSLDDYFDKLYLSYEIGAIKPNRKIFDFLIEDANINPSETLFIDDGVANIEMGKACGMKTYLATNGEDFRHLFITQF